MIFIDSSVLLDVMGSSGQQSAWSIEKFLGADTPVINHVVLAEVSGRFDDADALLQSVRDLQVDVLPLDHTIAHRAGKAFRSYRQKGGPRQTILPDFLIGAHAEQLGIPLLTRDTRRFRGHFPDLCLIIPEKTDD